MAKKIRVPSVGALLELFKASAFAAHAAYVNRYPGSPEELRLLRAIAEVFPSSSLLEAIDERANCLAISQGGTIDDDQLDMFGGHAHG